MNTEVMTRSELSRLGLDALDKGKVGLTSISRSAGGVSFIDAAQVMEFAKLMAVADKAVPKHLRANPGACLRIVFQAVEWQMSPWAVADKSYEVNDRIAYESQLIHAVIEARAPLQHRLDCSYAGEGDTRTCTVTGHFTSGDTREYTTPLFKAIRVKNSPLWKDDPDQQLFYYASRSWARKWCPDVLMGIYSRDELQREPGLGREDDSQAGLHARLVGSPASEEGHKPGHVESELDQIAADGKPPASAAASAGAIEASQEPESHPKGRAKAPVKAKKGGKQGPAPDMAPPEPAAVLAAEAGIPPKTAAAYLAYARAWLTACNDLAELKSRWKGERKLRNDLGVTAEARVPLDDLYGEKIAELES